MCLPVGESRNECTSSLQFHKLKKKKKSCYGLWNFLLTSAYFAICFPDTVALNFFEILVCQTLFCIIHIQAYPGDIRNSVSNHNKLCITMKQIEFYFIFPVHILSVKHCPIICHVCNNSIVSKNTMYKH